MNTFYVLAESSKPIQFDTFMFILLIVGILIVGAIAGFFGARYFFKKQLEKNPPINEKMIRAMFKSMGRTPSEKQVREVMKNVNSNK